MVAAIKPDEPAGDETFATRALNAALRNAWSTGVASQPVLTPGKLADEAIRLERGSLGGGHWEDALQVLTDELHASARLNPLGRTIAHGLLVRMLRQRIRAQRLWRLHPELLDCPTPRPVIILGHMRSGTTRLHRLLACDQRFSFTRLHENLEPIPISRLRSLLSASLTKGFLGLCNPQLWRIHPIGATAPEEEFGLHAFSLHGAMFEAQWNVPAFSRWCEQRDLRPVYREFGGLVRTIRWQRRDTAARTQLLKAPQFMQDIDQVLATFPDARFLLMQRDLGQVTASSASLVWNQQRVQSGAADRLRIGREWQRKTLLRQERVDRALRDRPALPVLPIQYDRMSFDWRAEMRQIYDFVGMRLTDDVVSRMARVASGSSHVGHRYSAADFGIAVSAKEGPDRSGNPVTEGWVSAGWR